MKKQNDDKEEEEEEEEEEKIDINGTEKEGNSCVAAMIECSTSAE